jgi:hypothetical protein
MGAQEGNLFAAIAAITMLTFLRPAPQPRTGKWMPVSGPLMETVGGWPLIQGRTPVVASFASQQGPSVIMVFHGEWIDRLAMIPKNQSMHVDGKLKEVERSNVVLDPCELIDSDPKANTPKRSPNSPAQP